MPPTPHRPTGPARPGVRYTTVSRLLECYRLLQAHPDGTVRVDAGTVWTRAEFLAWFHRCLDAKINREDGRRWRKLAPAYQADLALDARRVNDYVGRRIRHTGCAGLLRTEALRRRYPHIDRQPRDD